MTKLQTYSSSLEKSGISELPLYEQINEWVTKYGKLITYSICSLILVFVTVYYYTTGSQTVQEAQYIEAASQYSALSDLPAPSTEILDKFVSTLNQYPALHIKYDALIIQKYIESQGSSLPAPLVESWKHRTQQDSLKHYIDYALTTLLIHEKKYSEALKNALELEAKTLEMPHEIGVALRTYNLLRIAILNHLLGNKNEEVYAWKKFKDFLISNPSEISKTLTLGSINIIDYIDYRIHQTLE